MRNSPIRTVLRARVRPMIERLATDIVDLAAKRLEDELARLPEVMGVALSAFESNAEPDLLARALGPDLAAMMKAPPPEPEPVKTGACGAESGGASEWTCQLPKGHEGCHWSRLVGRWWDPPKVIDAKAGEVSPKVEAVKEQIAKLPPRRASGPQTTGKRQQTCSKCGFVGGNARGCSKSHPTQTAPVAGVDIARDGSPIVTVQSDASAVLASSSPNFGPVTTARKAWGPGQTVAPDDTPVALVRSVPPPDRRALIAARAAKPSEPALAEPDDDDDDDAEERWSASRLKDEIALAESQKREGELPVPRSTFAFGVMG